MSSDHLFVLCDKISVLWTYTLPRKKNITCNPDTMYSGALLETEKAVVCDV